MTDARTEARWDHAADHRKHWTPDPDPLPLRLQPNISPALEVAIAVKGTDNFTNAASLIDQYARTQAVAVPLDRRFAIARLVGYCEGIIKSGILGEEELRLRSIVAEVLVAFDMPSKAERSDG